MIFVTVGTQKFPFDRLLRAVDQGIGQGLIDETVFGQTGNSSYQPLFYEYTDFLSREDFEKRVAGCSVLITHSGIATIMLGLKYEKPVIVMPRLTCYGEHVDDHQKQIAELFEAKNFVLRCDGEEQLPGLIRKAVAHSFARYKSQRDHVVDTVRGYLKTL